MGAFQVRKWWMPVTNRSFDEAAQAITGYIVRYYSRLRPRITVDYHQMNRNDTEKLKAVLILVIFSQLIDERTDDVCMVNHDTKMDDGPDSLI